MAAYSFEVRCAGCDLGCVVGVMGTDVTSQVRSLASRGDLLVRPLRAEAREIEGRL
jgi:hypothetical protein